MCGEKAGILGDDARVGLDAEVDPVAQQLAVVVGRRGGVAVLRVALVVAAAGAEVADAAGRAAGAAAVEAAPEEGAEAGAVDILVNNAGITGGNAKLWEIDPVTWRQVMQVNLTAPYVICRALVPGMIARGYGRIVNIASIAGKEGNPNASHYSASKAGLIGLTQALATEFGAHGVRVNALLPGGTLTPMAHAMNATPEALAQARLEGERLGEPLVALVEQCLAQDPRPAYQKPQPERRYGARLWDVDVRWHYPEAGRIRVLEIARGADA